MGTDHTEFFEAGSSSRLQLRLVMCPSTRAQMCSQICTPVAFSCRRRRNSAAELGPLARLTIGFQCPRAILSGQIDAAWASIDADGSGGTDYDEFREWWNSAAGRCGWLPAATAF